MRFFKPISFVLLTFVLLCGMVGVPFPTESAAKGKSKSKIVTNKDLKKLILMLKEEVDWIKEDISDPCTVPPTWGGEIPGEERFVPTFVDGDGVAHAYIDCQTGLVWDAEPSGNTFVWGPEQDFFRNATNHCINRTGPWLGQKGGRLPSIPELASLVDTTSTLCSGGGPCLPDGHPFNNVQPVFYWSASTLAGNPTVAWDVFFLNGEVIFDNKEGGNHAWCVRGAMQESVY